MQRLIQEVRTMVVLVMEEKTDMDEEGTSHNLLLVLSNFSYRILHKLAFVNYYDNTFLQKKKTIRHTTFTIEKNYFRRNSLFLLKNQIQTIMTLTDNKITNR